MKPRLLFLTPTVPGTGGGTGLSVRASAVAAALGCHYEVVFAGPANSLADRIRRTIPAGLIRHTLAAPAEWPRNPVAAGTAVGLFDAVHVFRLYMAPYAEPYLGKIHCQLDLDESESRTRARIGEIFRSDGARALCNWESAFYTRMEREWLPRFDRVLVSSPEEAGIVAGYCPAPPVVVPNVVRVGARPSPAGEEGPFTLLFVGNLNYSPNRDAVQFFLTSILPLLRTAEP